MLIILDSAQSVLAVFLMYRRQVVRFLMAPSKFLPNRFGAKQPNVRRISEYDIHIGHGKLGPWAAVVIELVANPLRPTVVSGQLKPAENSRLVSARVSLP